jgi:catechol 2,3-dioxygenase-like lactoylglutathione lyase family enzyme
MVHNHGPVRFDHLNLSVRDFAEAAAWYGRVFGFEVVETGAMADGLPWGILRSGDSMLCISEQPQRLDLAGRPDADRFHRVFHFGIRLTDEAAWTARIKEAGVETFNSPIRYPHSTSWYVKDPSGHMIEVAFWDEDRVNFDRER